MSLRADVRADTTAQRAHAAATAAGLADALSDLAAAAKGYRRVAADRHPDLHEVHVAYRAVCAAEEAHDLAVLDVRSASGEDI